MAPVTSAPDGQDPLVVELLLITLALFTSTILSLTPSARARAQDHAERPSLFITISSILFALVALVVAVSALALAWLRRISLDALAGVVFALIPSLVSMPLDTVQHAYYRLFIGAFRSLSPRHSTFRYVVTGRPCGETPNSANWRDTFQGNCGGTECEAKTYVRYLANVSPEFGIDSIFSLHDWKRTSQTYASSSGRKKGLGGRGTDFQHRGQRIGHSRHTVLLRNFNFDSETRWWRAISSPTWLVARPWIVHLNTKRQMMHALALLSDITALGTLVLENRRELVWKQPRFTKRPRNGKTGTYAVVCNAILREIGLEEWRTTSSDIGAREFHYSNWSQEFGFLFYILTVTSNLYGAKQYEDHVDEIYLETAVSKFRHRQKHQTSEQKKFRVSAQTIIDELVAAKGICEEFEEVRRNAIDKWLKSWGCTLPTTEAS